MAGYKPVVLTILDGWGIGQNKNGNAVLNANTKNLNQYLKEYPNATLETSGEAVGLPQGQMGNSEVGHLNIGAGRIVYQDLTRISKSIKEGDFFNNQVLLEAYNNCINENKALHLMGLLSDGGVHSHLTHLFALIELAKQKSIKNLYIHCFLDGRDVPPKSALTYIEQLEKKLTQEGIGKIATISGRYYAMDRDKRWERIEKAYNAMVLGEGEKAETAVEAVINAYAADMTDEFVLPTIIMEKGQPVGIIEKGDSVIFFNFRADRARQITRALNDKEFEEFSRATGYLDLKFVCMTEYDATIDAPVAFPPEQLKNTLGEYLAAKGLKQLRIAETEKYAHVTFFFNGGVEVENPGEKRILIPSSKVATYDMKPEMSAYEVTDTVLKEIEKDIYDVIIINYANLDMVGHTGNYQAAVKAVEVIDECVKKVVDAVKEKGGVTIITSDHGNVEEMIEVNKGTPHTAHTNNPVPIVAIGLANGKELRQGGSLRDIAPTILELLELEQPIEMTGKSLIK